jgi:hypothetical protein
MRIGEIVVPAGAEVTVGDDDGETGRLIFKKLPDLVFAPGRTGQRVVRTGGAPLFPAE